MRIYSQAAKERARNRACCELCRQPNRWGLHAAHYLARGMGGGGTIDHDWNLVGACTTCHRLQHAGSIHPRRLLEAIGKREGVPTAVIEGWLWLVQRTDKVSGLPRKP